MKRTLISLLALLLTAGFVSAQDAKALYESKFSYDLKQDKESIIFDGKTFWLRMSSYKDDALTLTYFLKGETPLNATEMITAVLSAPGETLTAYSSKLLERTKALRPAEAEITVFNEFVGGEQRLVSFILQDKDNNLVQDSLFKLTQYTGARLEIVVHSIRMKLSEVIANPDVATQRIGDRRDARRGAITFLDYPF